MTDLRSSRVIHAGNSEFSTTQFFLQSRVIFLCDKMTSKSFHLVSKGLNLCQVEHYHILTRCLFVLRVFVCSQSQLRSARRGSQCASRFQRPSFAADREQLEIVSQLLSLLSPGFFFSLLVASDAEPERRNGFAIRAEGTLRVPLAMPAKNNSCLFPVRNPSAYDRGRVRSPRANVQAFPDRSYYINARCVSCLWRLLAAGCVFPARISRVAEKSHVRRRANYAPRAIADGIAIVAQRYRIVG